MKKVMYSVMIFLFGFLLLACKSDTHEADEYIEEYFSLAFADFEERIEYIDIISVHYIYVYAFPRKEEYGEEMRIFRFFIKYTNLDNVFKNDFIMVIKSGDEDISIPTMIGYEQAIDYSDQEISNMIKQYESQYSVLKAISKTYVMESRKMSVSMIQSFTNPS